MNDEITDRGLIGLVLSEPAALETLYRRHISRVIAFAARRCREPQDVADLAAATFVTVLESAHTYDPARGEVLPWIFGIERNLWADQVRGVHREREILGRALGDRPLAPDEYARLEEQIDAAQVGGAIGRALERVEPSERDVLLLAGHDELTSREAAATLGISPTAFRMRLSRARRSLDRALAQGGHNPALATTDARKER